MGSTVVCNWWDMVDPCRGVEQVTCGDLAMTSSPEATRYELGKARSGGYTFRSNAVIVVGGLYLLPGPGAPRHRPLIQLEARNTYCIHFTTSWHSSSPSSSTLDHSDRHGTYRCALRFEPYSVIAH